MLLAVIFCISSHLKSQILSSRMNEVFSQQILSGDNILQYPWEITYGPDDSLWVTESRGYKLYKIHPGNGGKRIVLDISTGSTWLGNTGNGDDTLNAQNMTSWTSWPQGGFAGMAIHPDFGKGMSKDFVYVTYIWKYMSGTSPAGVIYRNKLVRFTYNFTNGRLETPAVLDWNLPGSSDHNSQRLIIAPVEGTPFLFMGSGDMGSGQFGNRYRPINAQDPNSREGKILRYNLEPDADVSYYDKWIPNDNPYGSPTNAVWNIGMRNNQGFAYDTSTNTLYGAAHGPFSDDEINIIERRRNYGHPRVIGYSSDGNYNGNAARGFSNSITAGAPYTNCNITGYTPPPAYSSGSPYCGNSSLDPVGNEAANVTAINASGNGDYLNPIFSAYASTPALIASTWQNNPSNSGWESEGWSGLELYSNNMIPGWKRSLVAAGLKWGRMIRLPLDATGTKTLPSGIGSTTGNTGDTITYFQSPNRYRDLAFGPNGKDIYVIMDNGATSGPSGSANVVTACKGCVIKYSFLGYNSDASGLSKIPKNIAVSTGSTGTCNTANQITIDATNNNLWVPITGLDGNIVAEINAMGQNLGVVSTSYYLNEGAVRTNSGIKYLDRNITITPANNSFGTPVKIRLYLTGTEFTNYTNAGGVSNITFLRIHKNGDACGSTIQQNTTELSATTTNLANITQGTSGYVLQTSVTSFSSFYFAARNTVLPVQLISFTGKLNSDLSGLLQWKSENQVNLLAYGIERSVDGTNFYQIGSVNATSSASGSFAYTDRDAQNQNALTVYYRLKLTDTDGSYKYSIIVTINLPTTKGLISIAPNPVSDKLKGTVISPMTGNVTISIFDNAGRLVSRTGAFLVKGTNNILQNTSTLNSGLYYLTISGNGITIQSKFQKF